MSLIIFSCSPRLESKSNSAAAVGAFKDGYESAGGDKAEVYFLYKKKEWGHYKQAFEASTDIIFAMPLFVECVPGLVMEFLEYLEPKKDGGETRLGFILISGFNEAHQLRTGEHYLEKLPSYLNCEYAGTLIKGGTFMLAAAKEKKKEKMLRPFFQMGRHYAKEGLFDKAAVSTFAAPERYSRGFILLAALFKPLDAIAWKVIAKMSGAQGRLDARPYEI